MYAYLELCLCIITIVVSTVNFSQSVYSVAEDIGSLTPVVVLSNPVSNNFTVQIEDRSITAVGEYIVSINTCIWILSYSSRL